MRRWIRIARFLLPLTVASAAAVIRLQAGGAAAVGPGLWLLILAGVLLGGAAAVMLESVAVALDLVGQDDDGGERGRAELARERETLLRAIKDVEIDASLHKIDDEQARQLAEPLRRRALEVLAELGQASAGIEEQIERELARRLEDGAAGEAG
jgi:hypothetical protein